MLFYSLQRLVGSVAKFGLFKACFIRGMTVGLLLVIDLATMINHIA